MRLIFPLCAAFVFIVFGSVASADELRLKNGDRYTGSVVQLAGGTLTFKTAHGSLGIPWTEVAALIVSDAVVVKTVDGQVTTLAGGDIDVSTTAALNRPEPPLAITGGVAAGFVDTGGNTTVSSLRLAGDVTARARANRYTVSGAVNRAADRGAETARNWTSALKYDRFLTPRMFVNANTIFTNDQFRDIDLRTAVGGGIGYQMLSGARVKLSLDGGAGYVNENYDIGADDSYAALREAAALEVLIAVDRVVLFHQHDGYFGVTGDDNLFLKAQNGIRLALIAGLVAAAQLDLDYDRTPSPGRRHTDRTFALTFGYRF
jgi:putative salt-induced outer membrane protein YdiY